MQKRQQTECMQISLHKASMRTEVSSGSRQRVVPEYFRNICHALLVPTPAPP